MSFDQGRLIDQLLEVAEERIADVTCRQPAHRRDEEEDRDQAQAGNVDLGFTWQVDGNLKG